MRLNLTLGECSIIYTSLQTELRYLADLKSEKDWIVNRIVEIKELISKLDSL